MQHILSRAVLLGALFVFVSIVLVPIAAEAQYGGRYSSYSSKINKLDDDEVEDLFIPILFGVTLGNISPNFGDPRDGGDREHEGLDIMAPKGAPIVSPTDAVVIQTGNGSGSGQYVSTANPGDERFVYMHLSEILVKRGQELKAGDLIGYVGNTGNASGGAPHLHFEIRDGRKATDPFKRITETLSLKDKIKYLERAIDEAEDEDDFIEFVAENYQGELWQAEAAGIELPEDVAAALKKVTPVKTTTSSGGATGDLELGAQGSSVTTLQTFLIVKDTGPAAEALKAAGATGYFGPVTQRALIEYQKAHGISPAVGYYGPVTRAYILAHP